MNCCSRPTLRDVANAASAVFGNTPPIHGAGRRKSAPTGDAAFQRVVGGGCARSRARAVEDFRIDFEDGHGNRTPEEGTEAVADAEAVAQGAAAGIDARHRHSHQAAHRRARGRARTLDLFVTTLARAGSGKRWRTSW
jgi:hypothetical protein